MRSEVDWLDADNAAAYDAFARSYPMYMSLAKILSAFARSDSFSPDEIADVGCGTGKSTEALLTNFPSASVSSYDYSKPMLSLAKSNDPTRADRYFEMSDIKTREFQLIFSSAAFWQLELDTIRALFNDNLISGGRLVFNLPVDQSVFSRRPYLYLWHLFVRTISDRVFSFERKRFHYVGSSIEAADFLRIPIFTRLVAADEFLPASQFKAEWSLLKITKL